MQLPQRKTAVSSKVKTLFLAGFMAIIATSLGTATAWAELSGFIENDTHYRDDRGLSKVRNTAQLEYSKDLGAKGLFSEINFNTTLRATYDAVYDLRDEEWGDKAGGPVNMQQVGGQTPPPPWGPGAVFPALEVPYAPNTTGPGTFPVVLPYGDFDGVKNPNKGLENLGEHLHNPNGGLDLAVPVRPCDEDSRGCLDDYMDADLDDLRYPEFNDRQDWLREFYVDATIPLEDGKELGMKLGRQQIVWGRTDLFRVLDVINPVDYSRNNIYDELEDIRIPMWMLETELRTGPGEIFDDLNYSVVWNFDKFRPSTLGQGGTPNQINDAGSFFRSMKNLWDNGGTVGNFAFGNAATNFKPHTLGIRDVDLPDWKLSNTQVGAKVEGVYKDLGFSLNYLYTRQQLPTLRGGVPAFNPWGPLIGDLDEQPRAYLPAFDIVFPRVNLFGGSLDYYEQYTDSVFRLELAYTTGEEFANTADPELYSESDVIRWVLGWDRNTFVRSLNAKKAFLTSFQLFGQHLLDHELHDAPLGKIGMPDWENNYIGTLLVKGWWMRDRLSPQILVAHDYKAEATTIEPSISWLITDNLSITARYNVKTGHGARKFNDTRAANQFPPFSATPLHGDPATSVPQPIGINGYEPLGRFRSGPIGMAQNEDEVSFQIRYSF
jgi:hypothetical protein